MNTMRRALSAAAWVALCCLAPAAAQQSGQEQSVADAARRVRQQKAQEPKAVRVYTNDNLPGAPGAVSAVRTSGPASTGAAAPSGTAEAAREPAAASKEEDQERSEVEDKIAKTKERLATQKKDLELLSRDHDLERQQFFSNPGYSTDSAGRARFDALGNQVNAKRQEVQETEQELGALEEKLKGINEKLGPPKETSNPSQDAAYWRAKLQPLREELTRVESQIAQMQAAKTGTVPPSLAEWSGFSGNTAAQLERRRSELQRQISEIEDEARRAGVLPAWVR